MKALQAKAQHQLAVRSSGFPGPVDTEIVNGLYTNFVRRLDARDPDLRGGLSVQGVSKDGVNTLNVVGPSSLNGTVGVNGDVTLKDATNVVCSRQFESSSDPAIRN